MNTKEPKPLTFQAKQDILNGLYAKADFLMRGGTVFSPKIKEQTEALQYGLTTRLNSLVERFKIEEIDLKIASFKELVELIEPKA